MTSSFLIKKLDEDYRKGNMRWSNFSPDFNEHDSPLGGLEHTHVKINGDCHPDFYAVPIGGPYNAKLCRRKLISQEPIKREQPKTGYYRAVLNLYDVNAVTPTQITNPEAYPDRRIPWEADLIREDYLRLPVKYNANGIQTVRTPHELKDAPNPYFEYGFSFTPHENPSDGRRIATNLSQTIPPVKYDVTRLVQPYDTWKREHAYVRNPQDFRDQTLTKRIV